MKSIRVALPLLGMLVIVDASVYSGGYLIIAAGLGGLKMVQVTR